LLTRRRADPAALLALALPRLEELELAAACSTSVRQPWSISHLVPIEPLGALATLAGHPAQLWAAAFTTPMGPCRSGIQSSPSARPAAIASARWWILGTT